MESQARVPYYWPLARAVMTMASPIQKFVDKPGITHAHCNKQAILILQNDGFTGYARLLRHYYKALNAGAFWADLGWKNVTHYYDPLTGKGIGNCPHALWTLQLYLGRAENAWNKKKYARSFFFLGAASHLVQDLCEPHHACNAVFAGHQAFEGWAQDNFYRFAVFRGGDYQKYTPVERLKANALTARNFIKLVGEETGLEKYEQAAGVLLPLAQRSTAGFLAGFLARAGAARKRMHHRDL